MADTTTGIGFVQLKQALLSEIPYLDLTTHEDLALMDDTYKSYTVTQVSVSGNFDGSQFVQSLTDLCQNL